MPVKKVEPLIFFFKCGATVYIVPIEVMERYKVKSKIKAGFFSYW
jgi:hypothetical protein